MRNKTWYFVIGAIILVAAGIFWWTTMKSPPPATEAVRPVKPVTEDGPNWVGIFAGIFAAAVVGLLFWQRKALQAMVGTSPSVMDWSCQVTSAQKMGEYGLLITDTLNKTYTLDLGAILAGMQVPKGKWKTIMEEIGEGSELKFRVTAVEFAEAKTNAIAILRLNSYTPKYANVYQPAAA